MLANSNPLTSRIYSGNALDILKTLKDESVDLLLTDPPYGINYISKSKSLALRKIANDKASEAYTLLDKVLAIAAKKLKQNDWAFLSQARLSPSSPHIRPTSGGEE